MKHLIEQLNKAFDHRLRLGVMSILAIHDWTDFTTLRDQLNATDGNLASHLKALEKDGYVEVRKRFVGRKPNTSYQATAAGRQAFAQHLNVLEQLIKLRE